MHLGIQIDRQLQGIPGNGRFFGDHIDNIILGVHFHHAAAVFAAEAVDFTAFGVVFVVTFQAALADNIGNFITVSRHLFQLRFGDLPDGAENLAEIVAVGITAHRFFGNINTGIKLGIFRDDLGDGHAHIVSISAHGDGGIRAHPRLDDLINLVFGSFCICRQRAVGRVDVIFFFIVFLIGTAGALFLGFIGIGLGGFIIFICGRIFRFFRRFFRFKLFVYIFDRIGKSGMGDGFPGGLFRLKDIVAAEEFRQIFR